MERNWDRRRQEGEARIRKRRYRGRKDRQNTSPRRQTVAYHFLELPCEIRRPRFVRSGLGNLRHGGRRTDYLGVQRRSRQGRLQSGRARSKRAHHQSSIRRKAKAPRKPLRTGAQDPREQDGVRAARRNLGDAASRASGGLVIVDGDFRNSRHDRSAIGIKSEDRQVPQSETCARQRQSCLNRMGLPAGRIPQEAGIPSGTPRLAEIVAFQTVSSLKWRLPLSALAYSSLLRIFSSTCISTRKKFLNHVSIRS